jgi:hypothetical protein
MHVRKRRHAEEDGVGPLAEMLAEKLTEMASEIPAEMASGMLKRWRPRS